MAFKPVGVNEDSLFPTRVMNALKNLFTPVNHVALTSGIHGVGASTIESTSGSTSKVALHAASATAHAELRPIALALPMNAGTVNDATLTALGITPMNGHTVIDSTHGMRFTRLGGAWYGEQITGVTPWTPASVQSAALWGWYDASQLTGLNDGDQVASWTDMSGNGRHMVQTISSTYRPLYKTNVLNGKPGILFNGVNNRLDLSGYPGNPFTAFLVMKANSASSASSQQLLRTDQSHVMQVPFSGTSFQAISPAGTATPGANVNDGTPKIFMAQFDGSGNPGSTGYFARLNGAQGATLTAAEGTTPTKMYLGANNAGTPASVLVGYLFEVLIYAGRLSAADILAVETYLS